MILISSLFTSVSLTGLVMVEGCITLGYIRFPAHHCYYFEFVFVPSYLCLSPCIFFGLVFMHFIVFYAFLFCDFCLFHHYHPVVFLIVFLLLCVLDLRKACRLRHWGYDTSFPTCLDCFVTRKWRIPGGEQKRFQTRHVYCMLIPKPTYNGIRNNLNIHLFQAGFCLSQALLDLKIAYGWNQNLRKIHATCKSVHLNVAEY